MEKISNAYVSGSAIAGKGRVGVNEIILKCEFIDKELVGLLVNRLEISFESNAMINPKWIIPSNNGVKPYWIDEIWFNRVDDYMAIYGFAVFGGDRSRVQCCTKIAIQDFYSMLFSRYL